MEQKLLPCPFCGSKAKIIEGPTRFVRCTRCKNESADHTDVAIAVEKWNRRPPASEGEAVDFKIALRKLDGLGGKLRALDHVEEADDIHAFVKRARVFMEATRPTASEGEEKALELIQLYMELTHKTYWRLGNFKHWLSDRLLIKATRPTAPQCPTCNGTGIGSTAYGCNEVREYDCPACNGTGTAPEGEPPKPVGIQLGADAHQ